MVNLALYFREQVKDVPIIGAKVYTKAKEGLITSLGQILRTCYGKLLENMAYGLVSIFLVVIGIFIMLRKKTDPKTVLPTLQSSAAKSCHFSSSNNIQFCNRRYYDQLHIPTTKDFR